jgi:1,4-alpha-glucan branching enzyme
MSNNISTQIDRVIASDHHDPFQVLGLHFIDQKPKAALVRTFQPHAESVQIVIDGNKQYMYKMRQEGLFEIVLHEYSEPFPYHYEIKYFDKTVHATADPYCFLPQLGDMD